MKKTYESPEVRIVTFETESVLEVSVTTSDDGINTPFYPL